MAVGSPPPDAPWSGRAALQVKKFVRDQLKTEALPRLRQVRGGDNRRGEKRETSSREL